MIELKLSVDETNLVLTALDGVVRANGMQTNPAVFALNNKIHEMANKSPEIVAMNAANAKQAKVENIPAPKKKPGPKKK